MKVKINNREEEITMNGRAYLHASVSVSLTDEPWVYHIIPSGWNRPRRYHVVEELGDYERTEYLGLMTEDQLKEKFNLEIPLELTEINQTIKNLPNDYDLGGTIRQTANQIKEQPIKL